MPLILVMPLLLEVDLPVFSVICPRDWPGLDTTGAMSTTMPTARLGSEARDGEEESGEEESGEDER